MTWDYKGGWEPKNWCFQTAVLEKTLESPLDTILKDISLEYSLEGVMLKLQYFCHLMQRTDSFEKPLMLGKIEGRRRRELQRMRWLDDITDSVDLSFSEVSESEGQRSLVCCSSWDHRVREVSVTEQQKHGTTCHSHAKEFGLTSFSLWIFLLSIDRLCLHGQFLFLCVINESRVWPQPT